MPPTFSLDIIYKIVGGVVAKTLNAPFDRVCIIIQTDSESIKNGRMDFPVSGFADGFRRVREAESAIALWRGNFAAVLRIFPQEIVAGVLRDPLRRIFALPRTERFADRLTYALVGGCVSSFISLLVVYPFEYAHTRLAADVKSSMGHQFKGMLDCWRETITTDGIIGLYRGFGPALLSTILQRGIQYTLAEYLKPSLTLGSVIRYFGALILSYNIVVYPFITIRNRMMMTSGEPKHYRSFIHAFVKIAETEGIGALYRGVVGNIAASIVSFSLLMLWS
jgi:solute carrier family 25 (adenine nucleotide translocator) protein 4/5/6/31